MRKKQKQYTNDSDMNQLLEKAHERIEALQSQIDFLNVGIDSREEAYDEVNKDIERQKAITKQLTYLFILIDALDKLTHNDYSSMSRAIYKALNNFKAELAEGMLSLPNFNLTNIINDTTYEE